MSRDRRLTPQEKKHLAYEREIQRFVENPHTARKGRARWKASLNQATRSRIHQRLRQVVSPGDEAETAQSEVLAVAKKAVAAKLASRHRDQALNLRDRLVWKAERRLGRVGWNYPRHAFWDAQPRSFDRFETFLEHAITTPSEEHRRLARVFWRCLTEPAPHPLHSDFQVYLWRPFLTKFLAARPDWEPRLRAWAAEGFPENADEPFVRT